MRRHRISTAQLLLGTERAQLAVEQRWRNTNLDHGDMRIRSTTSRPGTDMGDFSEALRVPAQRQAGRVPTVRSIMQLLAYKLERRLHSRHQRELGAPMGQRLLVTVGFNRHAPRQRFVIFSS